MGKARARVAIIGCEPKDAIKLTHGNRRYDIRHLIRKKIEIFSRKFEPLVHWPAGDIKDFPAAKNIDAVVIPGSPLNADDETLSKTEWMRKLLDFIAHVHEKVPVLGICFGHQAIARAFGSGVITYTRRNVFYEIGFEPTRITPKGKEDHLFSGIPEVFPALYSHFQYIGSAPQDGVVLAKSGNHKNKSIQAYRVGNSTYGVQFHPDYDGENITEIVRSRNKLIMENIPLRRIVYSVAERHDHKVITNFLEII
jgi:GMP synthase (glutamine-hydrolysing)